MKAQQLIDQVCREIKEREQKRFNQSKEFWNAFYKKFDKELKLEFSK